MHARDYTSYDEDRAMWRTHKETGQAPGGQDGTASQTADIPTAPSSRSADEIRADVDTSTMTRPPAGQDGIHIPPAPQSGSADGKIPADVDISTKPGPKPGGQDGINIPTAPSSGSAEGKIPADVVISTPRSKPGRTGRDSCP